MKPSSSNHSVNSPENKFPELVITYIDFNNIKALPKYFEYSGTYYTYLLSNFLTFYIKNAPIKYN